MKDLRRRLEEICSRFGVASLDVFGSRAGEIAARVLGCAPAPALPGADVDVAVQPSGEALDAVGNRLALAQELEKLLDVDRVDLVMLPEANPFLAAEAVRGELLYCRDEDRQAREELCYLRRAADLAPYQKARLAAILSGEVRR